MMKRLLEYSFREIVSKAANERGSEYARVFQQAGLATEVSDRLQRHLAKIHLASLEAEVAIQQVLDARLKYDQQLNTVLDEEQYGRYRRYERAACHGG